MRSTIERFWNKVDINNDDSFCWEWLSYKDKDGYGCYEFNKKKMKTHRIAWMLTNGPIPAGLLVCHHCDNPSCCNPKHLFLGTNQDNIRDRHMKGRSYKPKSDSCWNAKLDWKMVQEIRETYSWYVVTVKQLAKKFNVAESTISSVIHNKKWKI